MSSTLSFRTASRNSTRIATRPGWFLREVTAGEHLDVIVHRGGPPNLDAMDTLSIACTVSRPRYLP